MDMPRASLLAGIPLVLAVSAQAQGVADPTRPPASLEQPVSGGDATPTGGVPASGVQTIVRRHQHGKPAALINGEFVVLGGRVGESRLVRVDEDSVTLRGPEGTEVLKLTPAVDKRVIVAESDATAAAKKRSLKRRDKEQP